MKGARVLGLLAIALFLTLLADLCLGSSGLTPRAVFSAVFSGDRVSAASRIFWYVRLPRALAALLAGTALSAAGYILQSVLRNPLASPGILGINSGAGLLALLVTAFFPQWTHLTPWAAFLGAALAAFTVYLLARLTGASRTTIVLAGIAVNTLLGAAMDAIVTLIPEALTGRSAFSIGGFAGVTMRQLGFAAPFCAAGLILALAFRRELELLGLGDEVAHSLGLRTEHFRALLLLCAALLAGAAVSFAGLLSFVGLVSPHISRQLMRRNARLQLPTAVLFGAALCLGCDLLARTLFAPYELPVGIVLSGLGAPFFLYLLLAGRRRSRHQAD